MKKAVTASTLTLLWLAVTLNSSAAAAQPRLTSITLERWGCMGSCPVYTLSLNDTGEATYTGYQFVPRVGVYKSHVDFATFLDIIASDDPWSLEDAGPFATDTPSLKITMVAGTKTRVVRLDRYFSMPRRFASIVAAMDGITAYSQWQSVGATALAGTYVWSDGVNALDELVVRANSEGGIHAALVHAASTSCNALLLPKTLSLGTLTLIDPGVAESTSGARIRKTTNGVLLEQAGKERSFYSVSTGAEFMLRAALEQSIIHNTLHKC